LDVREEVKLEKAFIRAAVGPAGFEAELVAILKPVSDLLDDLPAD